MSRYRPTALAQCLFAGVLLFFAARDTPADWRGFVAAEGRSFPSTPRDPGQQDDSASLVFEPQWRHAAHGSPWEFSLAPFLRLDSDDEERSHADLREAYGRYVGDTWDLLVGVNRVFWGVAESRHLVDIINQTDLIEDIDAEDKLGQPMINATLLRDWGTVGVFLLSGFRERSFPGERGRLRPSPPVDTDAARFESGAKTRRLDLAVRYAHVLGRWDVGTYYFNGTSREPRLLPDATGTRLIPHYDLIQQFGTDLQFTRGAWLWKFEGIVRKGQGKTFGAAVAGFEYTFYHIGGSNADLGVLLEYLHDGRDRQAPATPFDNDVFAGLRWARNDTQDTEVLAGVIVDSGDRGRFFNLEAKQRIGVRWTVELILRSFGDFAPDDPLSGIVRDDYLELRAAYHF